ncbi:MAG TPA: hypothetical protein PKC30_12270 [Saprospiraceae bacterium]|nr:hypothetical protein [Saprospiraceae bacterium]
MLYISRNIRSFLVHCTLLITLGLSYENTLAQPAPFNNTEDPTIKALNNYVYFVNESIHGLLIVHRLLENFNLDINKYVDLDSYQINFYSNQDLPEDIFEDPEHWFYDISPYEWFDISMGDSKHLDKALSEKLNTDARYIKDLISKVNGKRFIIEEIIQSRTLSNPDELQQVYDQLEECVELYESFFRAQIRLEKTIQAVNFPTPGYYKNMSALYTDFRAILENIRNKEEKGYSFYHKRLQTTLSQFDVSPTPEDNVKRGDIGFHLNNINKQTQKALISSNSYIRDEEVPNEYLLYGKYYYYYNSDIINKFNRYGSGIVFEMNTILDIYMASVIRFFEIPHFYKVIYPRKLEKLTAVAGADSKVDGGIPVVLEGRKIEKKAEAPIKVDNLVIDVEIFDHSIVDGDIVSLNFNGEWVLRNHTLTSKPKIIRLMLKPDEVNYLILHAENLGAIPPNTMALRYFLNGKKQEYIMESDMNTSEVIEIIPSVQ